MIKCPNCGADNLDGTLFCDQCIWDLTGVEPTPDAAAPAMAEAMPMEAEAMPMEAMAMEAMPMEAEAMPMEAEAMPMEAEAMPMEAGFADEPPLDAAYAEAPAEMADGGPPADAELLTDLGLAEPPADALPGEEAIGDDVMPIGDMSMPVSGVVPAEAVSQITPPLSQVDMAPADIAAAPASQAAPAIGPLTAGMRLSGQPKLVVVRGVKLSTEYALMEGTNFIGRFDELPVDIDLSDQEPTDKIWTSRQHACITWDGAGVSIEDLNSSNGTYINRNKLGGGEKKPLRNGDYVQVGAVLFQVKM